MPNGKYEQLVKTLGKEEEYRNIFKTINNISNFVGQNQKISSYLEQYAKSMLEIDCLNLDKAKLEKDIALYDKKIKNGNLTDVEKMNLINNRKNAESKLILIDMNIKNSENSATDNFNSFEKSIEEVNNKSIIKFNLTSEIELIRQNLAKINVACLKEIQNVKKDEVIKEKNNDIVEPKDMPKKSHEPSLDINNKQEYENSYIKYDDLKSDLEKVKQQIETQKTDLKTNSVKDKLASGYNKTKRKVIKVKDYVLDWNKQHPKNAKVIKISLIALAGLATYCAIYTSMYGTPLAGIGRCASALYNVLKPVCVKANITWPLDGLHSINKVLLGKMSGAIFNESTGVWTLAGKSINEMNAFVSILKSLEVGVFGAAAIKGTIAGIKKVNSRKNDWLHKAKEKFGVKLKEKISKLRKKTTDKVKILIKKGKNIKQLHDYYLECPIEELETDISDMESLLANKYWPLDMKDFSPREVNIVFQLAKKIYKKRISKEKTDDILDVIEDLSVEEIDAILADLEYVVRKVNEKELPMKFKKMIPQMHGQKDIDEIYELYNLLKNIQKEKYDKGVSR